MSSDRSAGQAEPGPYKVVELATVTDERLEATLNQWHASGYILEGMHFAMRESARRPSMAFLVFLRSRSEGEG